MAQSNPGSVKAQAIGVNQDQILAPSNQYPFSPGTAIMVSGQASQATTSIDGSFNYTDGSGTQQSDAVAVTISNQGTSSASWQAAPYILALANKAYTFNAVYHHDGAGDSQQTRTYNTSGSSSSSSSSGQFGSI